MSPSPRNAPSTSYRCRSEPQIPVDVTRMIASVGCSIVGSGTLSIRTSWTPCQARAFIAKSLPPGDAMHVLHGDELDAWAPSRSPGARLVVVDRAPAVPGDEVR